ncbi:MAG: DUF4263 domain-containing protein [Nitrospirae bacterium]|nr:DUF4263 domain-containing protein [Nitrospirota bacterium]
MLEKKYKIIKDSPPSISWGQYEKHILGEYKKLLENKAKDEKAFQDFFEKYPCMLPGSFGMLGESGHYPFAASVISQPNLVGLKTKKPDFMWIACDSGTVYPVLIEIEAPSKKWFVSSGKPSEKFNQAQNQLTDWKTWFSNPKHRLLFFDYYAVPSSFYDGKSVILLFVLIIGRRNEFDGKPELSEKRKHLEREHEFYMTYDRVQPSYKASDLLCCKVKDRKYKAMSVPATLRLGPVLSGDYCLIHDKESAVKKNSLISRKRKDFLIRRIPYWDNLGEIRSFHTRDFE